MSDYTDKVCPYCKTPFLPEDEIVLCSACDMPHHKDCWVENQGCTTFGCTGTIKGADGGVSSVTATQMQYEESAAQRIFCGRCGRENAAGYRFCAGCGAPLAAPPAQPVRQPTYTPPPVVSYGGYRSGYQSANGYQPQNAYPPREELNPDVLLLVGENWAYYQPEFADMKTRGTKISWNWASCLFAPFWLIYRKMYAYGAAALGITFVLSLFEAGFATLLLLGGYIAMGLFGNSVYLHVLENKLNVANAMGEPYRSAELASGGVNKGAAVLSVVGYIIFMITLFS